MPDGLDGTPFIALSAELQAVSVSLFQVSGLFTAKASAMWRPWSDDNFVAVVLNEVAEDVEVDVFSSAADVLVGCMMTLRRYQELWFSTFRGFECTF